MKGLLTKECPSCHHKFEFRSKVVAKPAVSNREAELEHHVLLLALRMGSVSAVAKAFEKLKTDPLMTFTVRCGGTENTLCLIGAKVKEM